MRDCQAASFGILFPTSAYFRHAAQVAAQARTSDLKELERMFKSARRSSTPLDTASSMPLYRELSSAQFSVRIIGRPVGYRLSVASVLAFIFIFSSPTAYAQEVPREISGAKTISATEVIDLYEAEAELIIIDSRTRVDFERGHIEGSINISDNDLTATALISAGAIQKTRPILFYCNGLTCGRAANAVRKALGWGYSNIYYFALGLDEWKANRLPLATHAQH